MPEISRFYGIVVRMYYDEHPPPHFHVYYRDTERGEPLFPIEPLE